MRFPIKESKITLIGSDGKQVDAFDWFGWTYDSMRSWVSHLHVGHLGMEGLIWNPEPETSEASLPADHPSLQQHILSYPVRVNSSTPLAVDSCILRHNIEGPRFTATSATIHHASLVEFHLPDGPGIEMVWLFDSWQFDMEGVERLPASLGNAGDYAPHNWSPGPMTWENDYSTLDDPRGDPILRGQVSDAFLNAT